MIARPFYPTEWLIQAGTTGKGMGNGGGVGNGGGTGGGAPGKGGPREQGRDTNPRGRERTGGGGPRRQPWIDDRHPKIVTMMADYIAARGARVQLTKILDAANKRITDLPTLPEYMKNGCPFICWAHMLGCCGFPNCAFRKGHIPRANITEQFADKVVATLTPGVQKCARPREQTESPGKCPKQE